MQLLFQAFELYSNYEYWIQLVDCPPLLQETIFVISALLSCTSNPFWSDLLYKEWIWPNRFFLEYGFHREEK